MFKSKSKIKIAIYFPVVSTGLLEVYVACCLHCPVAILHRKTLCWYKARMQFCMALGVGIWTRGRGFDLHGTGIQLHIRLFAIECRSVIGYQQKEHANIHALFTVFPVQQWTPENISGRKVYCFATNQMRDETTKDKKTLCWYKARIQFCMALGVEFEQGGGDFKTLNWSTHYRNSVTYKTFAIGCRSVIGYQQK